MFSAAVRAALNGHEPSPEQAAAIAHEPVPLAIIAGAGSGKTAVMAARMVWMTEREIAGPAQILGLSFTNKAAGELEQRIHSAFSQMNPAPAEMPAVMTYNSFADRLVREQGVRIGIDPEVGLLSEGQSWQLMLKALEDVGPFEAVDSRSVRSLCRDGLSLADQCHNQLLTPEDVAAQDRKIIRDPAFFGEEAVLAARKRLELTRLVGAYIQQKRRAQRIDYGDQVAQAVELLSLPEVAEELRQRHPAVLLDEYQDTNVAQRRMLEALVLDPAASGAGNVTAVGDARQNIFQWRGSTLFNLIDFSKHFPRRDGRRHEFVSLSRNFRSGASILAVANEIIEPVPPARRPGLPLQPAASDGSGFVGVKLLGDQRSEAAFIAGEILRLHGKPAAADRQPMDWADFAVLVRRRKHIGPIYEALRDAEIPVEVVGLGGLLEVPEVLDVLSWLRVVADPGPSSNRWLARILFGPRFRIHYRDLALLARWAENRTKELAREKEDSSTMPETEVADVADTTKFEPDEVAFSLTEALDHISEIQRLPAEAVTRLRDAREQIQALRAFAQAPLAALVKEVVDRSGVGEAVLASPRADAPAARRNLNQFMGWVDGFSPVYGEATLSGFLDYLDAAEEADDSWELEAGDVGDSVKLMTVHSAKGLEFETTFVPGVAARENDRGEKVDSIFPDTRTTNPMTSPSQLPYAARSDAEHLPQPWETGPAGTLRPKSPARFRQELKERAVEDERRLFYVALTRAKQRLYVTAAWWYERNLECRGPSTFYEEVRDLPMTNNLGEQARPEMSPMIEELSARAVWPASPPHSLLSLPELGGTYPGVLEDLLSGRTSADALLSGLDPAARRQAESELAGHRNSIAALSQIASARSEASRRRRAPLPVRSWSATTAVALSCGQMSARDLIRPLPERPSPARRIGTEIHSWIEEQALGLTGLADEEALDEPSGVVPPSRIADLRRSFREMGYPGRRLACLDGGQPMAELPFVLKLGDRLIRGRIDAVYEAEGQEAGLEIVDFKTGAEVDAPEIDQLLLYAAALAKLGLVLDRPLKLTFCFLGSRQTRSRTIEGKAAEEALERLEGHLNSAEGLP